MLNMPAKSHEAIRDADGQFEDADGSAIYSSLTYSTKGFGITGQVRKVDNWVVRTSPNEILLNRIMNYLPSLTKQNSLRLTARYQAVAQELGELGYQANLTWSPAKVTPSQPTFHIFQTLKMSSSFRKSTLMWKCARRPTNCW